MSRHPGRLVVISGPSGSGKTTVCKALKLHPEVEFSVSATTRARRPGEQDGVDYHFLDAAEFQLRVQGNEGRRLSLGSEGQLFGLMFIDARGNLQPSVLIPSLDRRGPQPQKAPPTEEEQAPPEEP